MLLFLFLLQYAFTNELSEVENFKSSDYNRDSKMLVYIYFSKPGEECPACTKFNSKMASVKEILVKKVNFYENPYLAAHFHQIVFPAFVIIDKGQSYLLNVNNFSELEEIIQNNDFSQKKKISKYLVFDSPITKVLAIFNLLFFYAVEYLSVIIENTPSFVFSSIIGFVIAYMALSIVSIFKDDNEYDKCK